LRHLVLPPAKLCYLRLLPILNRFAARFKYQQLCLNDTAAGLGKERDRFG
jgi:hypothetical protein